MRIIVALVLTLLNCGSVLGQSSRSDGSEQGWGAPLEGVELHVEVSSAPHPPNELPTLVARLRNRNAETVSFVAEAVGWGNVEIDRLWYTVTYVGSCCSARQSLGPNALSRPIPIRIERGHLLPQGNVPVTSFVTVPSGHHLVRIRTVTNKNFSIDTPANRGLVLVSNEIEIDMP